MASETDRFRLDERLGEGAFGEVYRAFDRERRSTVALKVLRGAAPDAVYRFKREFRALADLSHPNLVRLYELIHSSGTWMFSMEYIPGVDFLTWVRGDRPRAVALSDTLVETPLDKARLGSPGTNRPVPGLDLDVDRLRSALRQLVSGVSALHEAGYLHRDLKPSNVRVTPEGRVVVLDFGLVADVAPLDSKASSAIVGSPLYMSPEQAAGREAGPRADWYGVGVMLFEALTGRHPFEGKPLEVLLAKRTDRAPDPHLFHPAVPDDLASLAERLLATDPQVRPDAGRIRAKLGAPDESPAVGSREVERATFVGRDRQLDQLSEAYRRARDGHAVTVHIHGISGIGKSALVDRFLVDLAFREPETAILTGRCYEQEQVPYKAFDGVVDALSRFMCALPEAEAAELLPGELPSLIRVFPVLKRVPAVARAKRRKTPPVDAQELRRQAFSALRELLTRLAYQRPVVLYIDDLHWADSDSVRLGEALMSGPDSPQVLLLVTYRIDEVETNPLLHRLVHDSGMAPDVEVAVGPLSSSDAEQLVSALLPDGHQRGMELAREAGGHPLFLGLLAAATQDGQVTRSTTLDEVIRKRLSELSEAALRLLRTISIAGHPLERAIAYDAASFDRQDEEVLIELRVGRFIRLRGGEVDDAHAIEAYHDRIREVVAASVEPSERRALHERLGVILSAAPDADPEAVAEHFRQIGDWQRAAVHTLSAAERADEALAFDRAVRLYRLTLELTPPDAEVRRRTIHERLGEALANAGRGEEAAEAFLAAVGEEASPKALRLRQRAASQLLFSGRLTEGRQVMRGVWDAVGLREPKRPALAFLAQRALLTLRRGRVKRGAGGPLSERERLRLDACFDAGAALGLTDAIMGAYFATKYARWALDTGEPRRVAQALHLDIITDSFMRGVASQRRLHELAPRARELVDGLDDPQVAGDHHLALAIAESNAGHWSACRTHGEQAGAIYRDRCTGSWWFQYTAYMHVVLGTNMMGDLNELGDRPTRWMHEAEERGDVYSVTTLGALSFMEWLARDDVEGGRHRLNEIMARWDHPGLHIQHRNALWGHALLDCYGREPALAVKRITEALPTLKRAFRMNMHVDQVLFYRLRASACVARAGQAAAASRERKRLVAEARRDLKRLKGVPMKEARAHALLLSGSIAALADRTEQAVACWVEADADFEALDMTLHAAAVKRARGRLLGGDEGSRLVRAADELMVARSICNPKRMAESIVPGSS